MKQMCPCCHQEFTPPTLGEAGDMGDMFSCDHCQSVFKWENQSLKVVYESQNDPSLSPSVAEESESSSEEIADGQMIEEDPLFYEGDIASDSEAKEEITPPPPEGETGDLSEMEDPLELSELESEDGNVTYEEKSGALLEDSSEFISEREEDSMEEESELTEEDKGVSQNFSDVEEYGNAQATSQKGFLRYDLCVVGVDSTDIEKQVLSVLEDPFFKLEARKIVQSQKDGVLVIKNLNPIKAMCLVSQLSFLSVELSWEQYMALDVSEEPVES
jgi:hypothetical protein